MSHPSYVMQAPAPEHHAGTGRRKAERRRGCSRRAAAGLLAGLLALSGCARGVRGQSLPGPTEAPSPAPETGTRPPAPRGPLLEAETEAPDPAQSWDAGADAGILKHPDVPSPDALETPALINPVPLYDPSGQALGRFYQSLNATLAGEKTTRIAFFGASHVASDLFTDVIRARLQARFGEGGPGFTLVGKPWRWHRHGGVKFPLTRHFKGVRVLARSPKHDRYGLGGVVLRSGRRRATSRIATRPHADLSGEVDRIELYYLKHPRGGRVRVIVDGTRGATLRTRGPRFEPGYRTMDIPLGHHIVEFRTLADGPVHLFGAVLERSGGGVVLDTLGIPGSRARNHLYWDEAIYREHLAHRNPDLVVLAYGTNEAGDDDVPIEQYESRVRNVIERIQEIVPHADCLLVGPSDRPIRNQDDETILPRPRTAQLIAAQQRLSAELGCAFFDVVAFMGGEMSMVRWVEARPRLGAPDHIHFTRAGYEALGEALYDAIMADFTVAPPEVPPATAQGSSPTSAPHRLRAN